MALTTRVSDIPREVNFWYDKILLEDAFPLYTHIKWGQNRPLPSGAGTNSIKMRRYLRFSAATTALTEGITPTATAVVTEEVTATVQQYGAQTIITDVVDYESPDNVVSEVVSIHSDQAMNTMDQLTRDILVAGTNVEYGGDATSRITVDSADVITTTDVDVAVTGLENNNAKMINEMIGASPNTNTSPIDQTYIGITHPSTAPTIRAFTGFVPVEQYGTLDTKLPGEIGSYGRVRFVQTTNSKVFSGAGAAAIDVYVTLVLAKDAYAMTEISGQGLQSFVWKPGSGEDTLAQRTRIGWKTTFVAKILDERFLYRIEHAIA